MSLPRVSVIMPVFNAAPFLREAIASVLAQDFSDFELIVVNDGSTDASENIVHEFQDPRIHVVNNSRNMGIVESLNTGVRQARGEYIARMDADDVCVNTRFSKQVDFLDGHPEIAVLATRIQLIDEKGLELPDWKADVRTTSHRSIWRYMAFANCIAHPSVMIRSKVLKEHGYRTERARAEDYDLWLRLLDAGYNFSKIPERLVRYRIVSTSITHHQALPVNMIYGRVKVNMAWDSRKVGSLWFRLQLFTIGCFQLLLGNIRYGGRKLLAYRGAGNRKGIN